MLHGGSRRLRLDPVNRKAHVGSIPSSGMPYFPYFPLVKKILNPFPSLTGESVSLGEKINSYNLLQIEDSHPRIGGVVQEDDTAVIGESQVDDSFL